MTLRANESYGQHGLTPVDRLGVWLSQRAIHRPLPSRNEIDDHKMYYGKRDLWPMLVRGGFRPSQIQLSYHKFGLNLFAAARKAGLGQSE